MKVMTAIDRNVQDKNIDLSKTYTTQFVVMVRQDGRLSVAKTR